MRDSSPRIQVALAVIAVGALACSSPRWTIPWQAPPATVEIEAPAAPPEAMASHYLVISLARPGLHVESAERVARLLRDGLAQRGQSVTLAEDLGVTAEARRERTGLFEQLFHAPEASVLGRVREWTDPIGAERVLTCMLVDYGEPWRQDGKVKRIVVQTACDDVASGTRLARFQVIAERSGKRDAFSDVERLAAREVLERLGEELRTQQGAGREKIPPPDSSKAVPDATGTVRESSE